MRPPEGTCCATVCACLKSSSRSPAAFLAYQVAMKPSMAMPLYGFCLPAMSLLARLTLAAHIGIGFPVLIQTLRFFRHDFAGTRSRKNPPTLLDLPPLGKTTEGICAASLPGFLPCS